MTQVDVYLNSTFYANLLKLNAIHDRLNYEAIIYGQISNVTENIISDTQEECSIEKTNIICLGLLPIPESNLFYDRAGNIDSNALDKFKIGQEYQLIGFYKQRWNTPNSTINLLEKCICLNICKCLSIKNFLFLLNTNVNAITNENKNNFIFKNQHQLYLFDRNTIKFQLISINIKNIGMQSNTQMKYLNETNFINTNQIAKHDSENINRNINEIYKNVNNTVNKIEIELESNITELIKTEIKLNNELYKKIEEKKRKISANNNSNQLTINNDDDLNDIYIIDSIDDVEIEEVIEDNQRDSNQTQHLQPPPSYDSVVMKMSP